MKALKTILNNTQLRIRGDFKLWARRFVSTPLQRISERSQPPGSPKAQPLFHLNGEEDLVHWETQTDYSQGGNSSLSLLYSAVQPPHLIFSGQLDFRQELEYTGELYAEATLRRLHRFKYTGFNGLRMEVRSDGCLYTVYLARYHHFQTELHYVSIRDMTRKWTVLEVPLHCFNNAIFHPDEENAMQVEDGMTHCVIGVRVGIRRPSDQSGPFNLDIRSMDLIYREDLNSLRGRYNYPVMFKQMPDYTKTNYLDTGHSLIDIGEFHRKPPSLTPL